MSLIEVITALFILSLSIFIISEQVNTDIFGIKNAEKQIAEIYHAGL